jgi:hypothetical protein
VAIAPRKRGARRSDVCDLARKYCILNDLTPALSSMALALCNLSGPRRTFANQRIGRPEIAFITVGSSGSR